MARRSDGSVSKAGRKRVYIDFTEQAFRRLSKIKLLAEATSNSELLRNAIRLYEWYLERRKEGYKICLMKNDVVKEVELFF